MSAAKSIRTLRLQRLQGRLGEVAYQITRSHFQVVHHPTTWKPAANAYRCPDCVRVCLDLAGVDPASVELELAPDRLLVRGRRDLPEPAGHLREGLQVLVMEIDHGDFEREFRFAHPVDPKTVRLEANHGLLWVYLSLRGHFSHPATVPAARAVLALPVFPYGFLLRSLRPAPAFRRQPAGPRR